MKLSVFQQILIVEPFIYSVRTSSKVVAQIHYLLKTIMGLREYLQLYFIHHDFLLLDPFLTQTAFYYRAEEVSSQTHLGSEN